MIGLLNQFLSSKAVTVVLLLILSVVVYYIYSEGKEACQREVLKHNAEIIQKRQDIVNKRPDADSAVKRLLNGSF
tara:strand:- start:624 stop:848 length:225 start_codon:yes stop_codon:yes gene_type:complete